ncbi:hypothetical protein P9A16_34715 [Shinella sp. 838]|uniref:hypothetical protein n=1 Tax=unclassified Shinella TaxID=2643062 RepID=UPI0012E28D1D|nr:MULTISPECIES: hypothetical protein [unclassified Shinella]MDG4676232.1 hypothetical protein [Shinella sp. 838]
MARVFDDYLDDLIEIAHNIVMTNDIFLSNVRSNIINAFALIESSPTTRETAWTVEQAGIKLLKAYSTSPFYSDRRAVEAATKFFVDKVELLREEMHKCNLSNRGYAFGTH